MLQRFFARISPPDRVLIAVRVTLAVLLMLGSWAAGHLGKPIGTGDLAGTVALAVCAFAAHRHGHWRFVLGGLGMWLMALPFVLHGAGLVSYLIEVLIGKLVFLTSWASAELFD